jgi:hypothetical protein
MTAPPEQAAARPYMRLLRCADFEAATAAVNAMPGNIDRRAALDVVLGLLTVAAVSYKPLRGPWRNWRDSQIARAIERYVEVGEL